MRYRVWFAAGAAVALALSACKISPAGDAQSNEQAARSPEWKAFVDQYIEASFKELTQRVWSVIPLNDRILAMPPP